MYYPVHLKFENVKLLSCQDMPQNFIPLNLSSAVLHGRTGDGAFVKIPLTSHQVLNNEGETDHVSESTILQHAKLGYFEQALFLIKKNNKNEIYQKLAEMALEVLELDMAIEIYTIIQDISMVANLHQLRLIEDQNLLMGHLLVLLNYNLDEAQVNLNL